MSFALEDDICVLGTPVYKISWFVITTHTLLLASPTADHALRRHAGTSLAQSNTLNNIMHTNEASELDFDFVLYDHNGTAGGDKREVVDYSFLTALPQPARLPSQQQPLQERQRQLKNWIEASFLDHNRAHFPELLREASPTLAFEYDSVLRNIGAEAATGGTAATAVKSTASGSGGAATPSSCVQGLVLPSVDGSGSTVVDFTIPLLLTHAERAFQALSNLAVLYCKFAQHVWRAGYQVTAVSATLHVRIRVPPKKGKLTVLTEEVSVDIADCSNGVLSESLVPFLRSCLNLSDLPKLSLNQQGEGFIDYLPQLDDVLFHRLREPLHFVKLILGLSADFGSPVECSVSCRPLSSLDVTGIAPPSPPHGSANGAATATVPSPAMLSRKTAVFCVIDGATSIGFTVGVHYHSGEELPSIETTCLQYLDNKHEAPLSAKVKYARTGADMPKDGDGFVDVEELRRAVVQGVMNCMAQSMVVA